MEKYALTMRDIQKSFGNLQVLKNVQLNLYKGEIMALMGENGAGKSTMMKILTGIERLDHGTMSLFGEDYTPKNVQDSESKGVVIIHQELNLFDEMTVLDNIFLGNEIIKNGVCIDYQAETKELLELFKTLSINFDLKQYIHELSIGQRQLVEIVKALRKKAEILIMDEPTSALSKDEIEHIFKILKLLKEKGVAIVYISHRMQEIYQICDRVTVLRDGEFIAEHSLQNLPEDELIKLMVGREISDPFPYLLIEPQEEYLTVENLENDYVKNINFSLRKGEILGIGGLMGAGRTSLAHILYGLQKYTSGTIKIADKPVSLKTPQDALNYQIVYISEDRKGDGLFINFPIRHNISMPSLHMMTNKLGHICKELEDKLGNTFKELTKVKANDLEVPVYTLSGGNQQKVAIAKALLTGPRVLILDEPTRGIDIGARREIYTLINEFKAKGTAIILISSDLPELLALSDKVLVMSEGKMTGLLNGEEKSPENVMKLAVNYSQEVL
ncbi:MAG: sugar ABC transporter ATP-binding protein [Brevinemataceae bacterium]